MGRRKKLTLVQKHKEAITDMIWMSIRYCIGRHTIAAAMHTQNLVKFISDCPEFTEEDRKRFARDIIARINEVVGNNSNVSVKLYGECDKFDAYFLLCKYAYEWMVTYDKTYQEWEVHFRTHDFELDCVDGIVEEFPREIKNEGKFDYISSIWDLEIDLKGWSKFAQYLNPIHEIKYNDTEANEIHDKAIRYYSVSRYEGDEYPSLYEHFCPWAVYESRPYNDTYIPVEFIKEII